MDSICFHLVSCVSMSYNDFEKESLVMQDQVTEAQESSAFTRGFLYGVLFSVPLWALTAVLAKALFF